MVGTEWLSDVTLKPAMRGCGGSPALAVALQQAAVSAIRASITRATFQGLRACRTSISVLSRGRLGETARGLMVVTRGRLCCDTSARPDDADGACGARGGSCATGTSARAEVISAV